MLAACLDAPPGNIGDGGASDSDGAPGADASLITCPAEIDIPFNSEEDVAGWTAQVGKECTISLTDGGLEFTNMGGISICRVSAEGQLDMRGGVRQVRLDDADANLNMAVSLVLGPREQVFDNRRWIYFERDESQLRFGECAPGSACVDTMFGSIDYVPTTHVYLRFRHDPDTGSLHFETAEGGDFWLSHSSAPDVSFEDLYCLGIDLGSYEDAASGVDSTSSFADLSGGPNPAVTRP